MVDSVYILGSKSEAQRAIMLGSVFGARIHGLGDCDDVQAALSLAQGMGASINAGIIEKKHKATCVANVRASATSFRMGVLLMLAQFGEAHLSMDSQLAQRPRGDLLNFFDEHGIDYMLEKNVLHCYGTLKAGLYRIKGGISSQYLSGLLLALASLRGKSTVFYENISSFSYVKLTIEMLKNFGTIVEHSENKIVLDARNAQAAEVFLYADWSSAAPFLAAKALGHKVDLRGNWEGNHPDKSFLKILEQIGYRVRDVNFIETHLLRPVHLDCDTFPDLVPFIALVLTQVEGESVLFNVGRLKYKECDRLSTTEKILSSIGATIKCNNNEMFIHGKKELWEGGIRIDCQSDHRMLMLAAIAQLNCKNRLLIEDRMAVKKSFPNFWEEYAKIEVSHEYLG